MSFCVSEETPFQIETEDWARPAPHGGAFWQQLPHTRPVRLGLVVLAGSRVVLPEVPVNAGETGMIVFGAGLPNISPDGLDAVVRVAGREVYRRHIPSFDPSAPWIKASIDWKGFEGPVSVECGAGVNDNPSGDWLAIYELVSAPPEQASLWRARAFRALRENNIFPAAGAPFAEEKTGGLAGLFRKASRSLSPPGPHRYATDLLQKDLKRPIPDFARRLEHRLKAARRLRVLSLCPGNAHKELRLMQRVKRSGEISLTLVDRQLPPKDACERLAAVCDVRTITADVNSLDLQGERYDVILCTGGLSQVVELEHLAQEIRKGLTDEGEFWAIGQYAGRNGAMLWPEAYAFANPFFRRLPPRYRLNHAWPDKPVDADLPNTDASVGTFNCIRSEDIEKCLGEHLSPVEITKQTCFLWRFFDAAYRANYDLGRKEDRAIIARAARVDAEHQRHGGRPTSLDAVYRRR